MGDRGLYLYNTQENKKVLLDEIANGEVPTAGVFNNYAERFHGHRSLTGLLDMIVGFSIVGQVNETAKKLAQSIPVGSSPVVADALENVYELILRCAWDSIFRTLNYCVDHMKDILDPPCGKAGTEAFNRIIAGAREQSELARNMLERIHNIEYPREAAFVYKVAHEAAFMVSPAIYQGESFKLRDFALSEFSRLSKAAS